MGLRKVAAKHGISFTGLADRIKKGRSIQENNATKQLLTPAEEQKIVELISISSDWGKPLKNSDIKKYATALLRAKTEDPKVEQALGQPTRKMLEPDLCKGVV